MQEELNAAMEVSGTLFCSTLYTEKLSDSYREFNLLLVRFIVWSSALWFISYFSAFYDRICRICL